MHTRSYDPLAYAFSTRESTGGAIINTSSVCGLIGHKYTPEAYTASKGAVTLLTKAVASRYAKYGIRCNSIHPSTIHTPYADTFLKDAQLKSERIGEVPLGRLATVDDVSNAVYTWQVTRRRLPMA